MTKPAARKRTARTGDTVRAGGGKSGALFSTNMIPDSDVEYKSGLSAVYRYILSMEWGATNEHA